ncbi:hypothetical protein [Hydrogenobacter thermophilus]|jgi:hypothetical protein|uniref:hypothetical protein n=1 Tax=Hydrogenobacter thermophilus TaxID=940 RepID=UPI0030F83F8E
MIKLKFGKGNYQAELIYSSLSKTEFFKQFRGFEKYVAERMAEKVREIIASQLYAGKQWKPLSKNYLRRKKKLGYDTRTLIASGKYFRSIGVYRSGDAYVVSTKPFQIHMGNPGLSEGGMQMRLLAKWLEYGTSKMPPRPHFRPAFNYVKRNIRRYFHEYLSKSIGHSAGF